jgi:hypothetical protein
MEMWLTHQIGINNLAQIISSYNSRAMAHPLDFSIIQQQIPNLDKFAGAVRWGRFGLIPFLELFKSLFGGK